MCQKHPKLSCSLNETTVPYILMYKKKDVFNVENAGPSCSSHAGPEQVQVTAAEKSGTMKEPSCQAKRARNTAEMEEEVEEPAKKTRMGDSLDSTLKCQTPSQRMKKMRSKQSQADKEKEKEKDKQSHAAKRADQTEEEKDRIREMDRDKKRKEKEGKERDAKARIHAFMEDIKYGRIFECICCHRRLFCTSMKKVVDEISYRQLLEEKYPGLFEIAIGAFETRKSPDETNGCYHVCTSCHVTLNRGKMPAMSHKNSLQLFDITAFPQLHLTEVEHSLIALNLIFQKIYQLPKSRWAAMKDKTINIPVYECDVLQTVESLPRTPSEAGIIAVKLKRKVEYKNTHKFQYVSVPKVLAALHTLKIYNRYYHFVPDIIQFKEKCRESDVGGFNLLFPNDDELPDMACDDDADVFLTTVADDSLLPHNSDDGAMGSDGDEGDCADNTASHMAGVVTGRNIDINQSASMHNENALHPDAFIDNCDEEEDEGIDFRIDRVNVGINNAGDSEEEDNKEGKNYTKADVASTDDGADSSDEEEDDKEEKEYLTKDPVRKWTFDYNKSSCFSNDYPELTHKDDDITAHAVAPGEGKRPTNVLEENDWDLKTFPCLHPDAKNGLHEESRTVKLTHQYYFNQRLLNKDKRFANDPAFVFAVAAYIEKKQMQNNLGISFIRGTRTDTSGGSSTYNLDDPFSVLDNVKNTPRYWQKAKGEMIARLENLGPFAFFFTLSSGDMRWPENFTSLLDGHKITYATETEECRVDGQLLEDFLKNHQSKHEFIRKNLLNATLTFHHRVKAFIRNIVMSKGSSMCVNYYSYKTEFAFRGAAHIHGVLWVDWDKCQAVPDENIEDENGNITTVCHMENIRSLLSDIKDDQYDADTTVEKLRSVEKFIDQFVTCSLIDTDIQNTVKEVNCHHHTRTCRKYGSACRFNFPKYPSVRTIVAAPARLKFKDVPPAESEACMKRYRDILKKVKTVLEDHSKMETIEKFQQEIIDEYLHGHRTDEELQKCMLDRLENFLRLAGIQCDKGGNRIPIYEEALMVVKGGYAITYKRDISEIYANTYNKEWLTAWNANMDIQLCLDYFAVITYIADYYAKDDSGTLKYIKEALTQYDKQGYHDDIKSKLKLVINKFLTHRQIGESEAYYRILQSLHLKSSNTQCKFVQTGFKKKSKCFLAEVK